MEVFDTVVIGLGAQGAATLMQLARRGQRVIGLDRFDPPHSMGSTHGETRITRCAIGEGEDYVPLVLRSHAIWRELEAETGFELLTQCGALILSGRADMAPMHGKPDFVRRTIRAAERFGLAHEVLDAEGVTKRFPQFRLRGDEIAYFEQDGGFVRPERCVEAQLVVAKRLGAVVRTGAQVVSVLRDGAGVCVHLLDGSRVLAGQAVMAAGAWSPGLLMASGAGGLAPRMQVLRQVLHWFAPAVPGDYAPERFPVFIWAHGNGEDDSFYGFPVPHDGEGVKVAREQYATVADDPDSVARDVAGAEQAAMFSDQVAGRLAGVSSRAVKSKVCLYTMTSDGDFLIGRAAENDRVLLVSACSGHGFKHSAGLGEAVASAIVDGEWGVLAAFAPQRPEIVAIS